MSDVPNFDPSLSHFLRSTKEVEPAVNTHNFSLIHLKHQKLGEEIFLLSDVVSAASASSAASDDVSKKYPD